LQSQLNPADSAQLTLTADDVQRLLTDTSAQPRVEMTHKIGAAYNGKSAAPLGAREILIAEQIFRLLVRDTELAVRTSLASYVKDSKTIPHDIVIKMAQDVEEVSLPILQFSEVLTDDDLMDLIAAKDELSRYLAVSRRRVVSDRISDALIEKNHPEVISTLVSNAGAIISEHALERIIHDHKRNEVMMQAVSRRSYLPVATVEKLISVVSSSLADTLKQKYKTPDIAIDREIEKTRENETLHLIRHTHSESEIEKLVRQLHATGRLTPSIILSALCQGDFSFFENSLAHLSNIPVANARKLITDRGELGFRAIYNKSGLPEAMFPAVKLLLKIVRELDSEGEKKGGSRYANRIVERILHHAEDAPMENLSYIIALVRRVAH
jgi:uncharacterized protein (DUF2336 family)